jgi:hypothetical protein
MADLKELCDSVLSESLVSHASATQTTIYTVPAGKTCILTKLIIVAAGDEGATDITVGGNGTYDDWLGTNGDGTDPHQLDNLDAAGDVAVITPDFTADPTTGLTTYVAGTTIKVDVVAANGNSGNRYILFGILY